VLYINCVSNRFLHMILFGYNSE